jgi:hypothetical protein
MFIAFQVFSIYIVGSIKFEERERSNKIVHLKKLFLLVGEFKDINDL